MENERKKMLDTEKLLISNKTLKMLDTATDPWMASNYPEKGIYYSSKVNWYFFTDGKAVQGVPKELFEMAFSEADNKPNQQINSELNQELFLKTVALLSGKALDYKNL